MNSALVLQEKKRLVEALLELQRVNESLLDAAHSSAKDRPEGAVVYSMSAESAQLLGELRSRQRVYCPVSGLERSAAASSADPHKDEVSHFLIWKHCTGLFASCKAGWHGSLCIMRSHRAK